MSVVSVGVFDGLHLGHLEILHAAARRAASLPRVVVSFDPHPDVVLSKTFSPAPPLTPLGEKGARLAALGIRRFDVLPFTRELAALEPETFVERHLLEPYAMTALVVGRNFALGRGRSGNIERLSAIGRERGFEVEAVPLLRMDGDSVSSSRIRDLLAGGDVARAARLLGRRYTLSGRVVPGEAIGRTLGFPTANLRLHEEKLLPADGVYAVRARIGDESLWRPAAMSLGSRPVFDGKERALEVHLLDWSGELAGRELEVELVEWIRGQEKFPSAEVLVQAMRRDLEETRRLLGLEAGTPGT
jgi:riboflavin kinase/FMN adenylyltransferase